MNGRSALVVDDDTQILKLIKVNLEARGFDVTVALDGESALDLFEQSVPDIVLLDITLPGINGIQVCHRIRQRSNVPIIMVSANIAEKAYTVALNAGANDYVSKPFTIDDLLAHINAWLPYKDVNVT